MEAIVLWKSATETAPWKTLTAISFRVCFPSARIRFVGPQGNASGPTFFPDLFYVGDDPENYRGSVSGFLAEIDRMQLEVREYLSIHPAEAAPGRTSEQGAAN